MYVNYRGFYKPNANMKKIHALFSIFLFSICSFGQMDNDGLHEKFLQLLKKEKIDSIYYSYLKVNEGDQKYEEALLYRNQYGWALHELEQLKKDFPAIIKLSRYSNEMEYEKTLHLQRFPPSEWNNLLELATELEKHFESKPIEHREILGVKTMLEFITKNDSALILDASKLLKLMSKNSEAYSMMLWNYGNVLIRTDNNKQAINVFEKGLNQTTNIRFLHSLVRLYYFNKEYEKIISFENQINNDSSGILFFNLAEAYLKQNNIEKAEKYFPLVATIFIFIMFSNLLGIFPGVGSFTIEHEAHHVPLFRSPAADLNFTLAFAVISVVMTNIIGMAAVGVLPHISKFLNFNICFLRYGF